MKTCKRGHQSEPYKNGSCRVCVKEQGIAFRQKLKLDPELAALHRQKQRDYRRERYHRDPEWRARLHRHAKKSTDKRREIDAEFAKREREWFRAYHVKKKASDPGYLERNRLRTKALRASPEYAQRERERGKAYDRLRADSRKEAKSIYMRERFKKPQVREMHSVNHHKRRARLDGCVVVGVTAKQWRTIRVAYALDDGRHACAYCRAACSPTMDHVIPIARGGEHSPANVVPACKRCNSSKRDRLLSEWHRAPPGFVQKNI